MSATVSNLRKRLAKVEQRMTAIARRQGLANCNCRKITTASAGNTEEFEAEMNLPCPVHGLRRLGSLVLVGGVESENDEESVKKSIRQENAELDQLLATYEARLAEQDSQKLEEDGDDAEEF